MGPAPPSALGLSKRDPSFLLPLCITVWPTPHLPQNSKSSIRSAALATPANPPETLLFLSNPDSVLRASARLAGRFTTALGSMSHARKGQPLPGPQPLASSGASLAIPFQTHNSSLPPSKSQPSGPVGKDLELILYESKCLSLTPKPRLSPLVFPASGDRVNTVTQTQGKEAKKTHAPDVTSRVRTVLLCAAGQDHRHADLPEPGPGQPLQLLFQARSPGVQNHVDSTHFFHCPVPPLGTPSLSQKQALRMLPGDPTPRQNISSTRPGLSPVPQPRAQRPAERGHSLKTRFP